MENVNFSAIRVFLVATSLLLLAGCAGKDRPSPTELETAAFDDLRAEIEAVVIDVDRSREALAIADQLQQEFTTLREQLLSRGEQIRLLNARYDTTRNQFKLLLDQIQADMVDNQRRISTLHRRLAEVTTAAEWRQLAKSRSASMDAAITSIRLL